MKIPRHGLWGNMGRYAAILDKVPLPDASPEPHAATVAKLSEIGAYVTRPTNHMEPGRLYITTLAGWHKAPARIGLHTFRAQRLPKKVEGFSELTQVRLLCIRNGCGCTPMHCATVWQVATATPQPVFLLHCRAVSLCRRARCSESQPVEPAVKPPPDAKAQDEVEAKSLQQLTEVLGALGELHPSPEVSFTLTPHGELPSAPLSRSHVAPPPKRARVESTANLVGLPAEPPRSPLPAAPEARVPPPPPPVPSTAVPPVLPLFRDLHLSLPSFGSLDDPFQGLAAVKSALGELAALRSPLCAPAAPAAPAAGARRTAAKPAKHGAPAPAPAPTAPAAAPAVPVAPHAWPFPMALQAGGAMHPFFPFGLPFGLPPPPPPPPQPQPREQPQPPAPVPSSFDDLLMTPLVHHMCDDDLILPAGDLLLSMGG